MKGTGLKIAFAAGGTGGHLYPALAVAEALRELRESWQVTFIGRRHSFEEEKVRESGYAFWGISARGWSRSQMHKNFSVPFVMAFSWFRIVLRLLSARPASVLGTGGYVSAPTLAAARFLRIPVAIQEQNTCPGWVTRWGASFARRVFLAYDEARGLLPKRSSGILTMGMPIRPIPAYRKEEVLERRGLDPGRPVFLVFGGSQGSQTLNQWMKEAAPVIAREGHCQVVWQTGFREWQTRSVFSSGNGNGIKVLPYLDPIYDFLAVADLILCRAGASTLAEVTAFGVPALMVPYPRATDNHQEKNARFVEAAGAGLCLTEKDTDARKLSQTVIGLLADRPRMAEMGRRSKALGKPDAARRTAEEFVRMVEQEA